MKMRRATTTKTKSETLRTLPGVNILLRRSFILLCLAVVVTILVVYRRGDDQIRASASSIFHDQFPSLTTSFTGIHLDATRGVRLTGLAWRLPDSPEEVDPLLEVEELYVACPIDLQSFLAGKFEPRKLVIRRPKLRISRVAPNVFDELSLLIPRGSQSPSCELEIVDGTVIAHTTTGETHISGIHANLIPSVSENTPKAPPKNVSAVRIRPSAIRTTEYTANTGGLILSRSYVEGQKNNDETRAQPAQPLISSHWLIKATISNPFVETLNLSGTIDSNTWSFHGTVSKLDLASTRELFRSISSKQQLLDALQGKTSLDFELSGSTSEPLDVQYKIEGAAQNCALTTKALKYPLSEIELRYRATNESATIEKFSAHCGLTSIKAAYRQTGSFTSPEKASMRIRLKNFPLNDKFLLQLANDAKKNPRASSQDELDRLIEFIRDYDFSATTNIDVTAEKSSQTENNWKPTNLEITGTDATFIYKDFPYRLDQLTGRVTLDSKGTLSIALHSSTSAFPVRIEGRFFTVLDNPRGQVDITTQNRAIDDKLFTALPGSRREELLKLHPTGTFDAKLRLIYDDESDPDDPLHIQAFLSVRDGTIQYDLFPMPIGSISGELYMRDGAWIFPTLTGTSGGATLTASGSLINGLTLEEITDEFRSSQTTLTPSGAQFVDVTGEDTESSPAPIELFASTPIPSEPLQPDAWRFQLTTDVQNFPLGEELRSALVSYNKKDEFTKLHIDGKASGQIRTAYRTDTDKFSLEFDMQPISGTVHAHPEGFPYELREIAGQFSYREGGITVDGLRAKSGRTTYSANMKTQQIPERGWTLDLTSLRIDQFQIDRDLQSATSNQTLAFLLFLNPSGSFNVDGAIHAFKGEGSQAKLQTSWNLRFIAQQNSARPFVQLDAICGSTKVVGTNIEGKTPTVFGEINIDSLYYNGLQIANIQGPFFFDGTVFYWGQAAPPVQRTTLYQDPFLRSRIDADPDFQQATTNKDLTLASQGRRFTAITRGQAASNAPGFTETSNGPNTVESSFSSFPGHRSIQAEIFNGVFISDGKYSLQDAPSYKFTLDLHNGRLEDVSRYFAPGSKPLKGRVGARAIIQGEGRSIATLKGDGDVTVQEAELYELPQIVKILQILSVKDPDESAFNAATVKFQVLGDRLKLSNVLLRGDALTLFGNGWITLKGEEKLVDLTLNSRLGNASNQIPIVSDVIGEVGDQLTQIRVEGNLKSPIIHQEAAPGVKKAWWSIFPDREPQPIDKTPVERSRPFRDAWKWLTGKTETE